MRTRKVSLIGVPSSAGARRTGQEGAPAAFRAAGLLEKLRAKGLDVVDVGRLASCLLPPRPRTSPAAERRSGRPVSRARPPIASSTPLPAASALLVLGGDCTVGLGVVAGLCQRYPRLGLLYFDGDVDLNTPDTTPSGIFDGMVVAHLLGRGVPELAGLGPRNPLLSEEDLVLFGYDEESGSFDPPELDVLEHSRICKVPPCSRSPASSGRQSQKEALSVPPARTGRLSPSLRRRRHQPLRPPTSTIRAASTFARPSPRSRSSSPLPRARPWSSPSSTPRRTKTASTPRAWWTGWLKASDGN